MDCAPISPNANAKPGSAPARKVDASSTRSTLTNATKKGPRRSQLFAFTVRLTPEQREHFEALAIAQGHASVAATFKAQALSYGMEHPLQEVRLSLEHMQERITEEGAWLQDRIQTVSHALDGIDQRVAELMVEIQNCTEAMVLFSQTNEALAMAVAQLSNQRSRQPAGPPSTNR